jgi:hypothetical protein
LLSLLIAVVQYTRINNVVIVVGDLVSRQCDRACLIGVWVRFDDVPETECLKET